jgi:Mg2+ and Co2+ transporter CorA
MTTIRVSLLDNDVLRQGGVELLDAWTPDGENRVWVDIEAPVNEIIEPLLEERMGFHELAAEDTLSPSTLPKYDSFTNYDF